MTRHDYIKPHIQIVAEIGCCHIGNLERAKNLALLAKKSGANYLKTQKRNPKESVPEKLWNQPHPNNRFSYGRTYLEHRENLELSIEEHNDLKSYCEQIGITYTTSVWDITSAKEIIELNPLFIKVPSPCNKNYKLVKYLMNNFKNTLHISFGLTNREERQEIHDFLSPYRDKVVPYHCTSLYPCPFEKLHLYEIKELSRIYPRYGFSNHGYGIAVDIAAYMLGVSYIERHFIDDRTFKHTDAAASLEPAGLQKLTRDIHNVKTSLSYDIDELSEEELKQKEKLSNY